MNKTIQIGFLGALAAGLLGCASVEQPRVPPGSAFRVLSYNVHEGAGSYSNTLGVVLASKADVVVMQECSAGWIQRVGPEVKGEYPHIQSCYDSHILFPNGFSIFSKWPCKEIAFMTDPHTFYGAWLVEIQSPIGRVLVLSVHLTSPADKNGNPSIIRYCLGRAAKREAIRRYYARAPVGMPLIVLGDFNEGDHGDAVGWLERQGLTDALPLYDRRTPTWEGYYWFIPLRLRPDHILFSSDFVCYSSGVIRSGGSDHQAVRAVLGRVRDDPRYTADKIAPP